MKKRAGFRILVFAILSLVATAGLSETSLAQADELANAGSSGPKMTQASKPIADLGNWYWGLLEDPTLSSGTTAVVSDAKTPSTIYVGGPGYIAVSTNSGAEWKTVLGVEETVISVDAPDDEEVDENGEVITLTKEQKVKILREYISQGLEDDEFEQSEIENILENITDDELLDASTIDEIEELKTYNLSMDHDLSLAFANNRDNEVAISVNLSEFDSFITRYTAMVNSGAEEDYAISMAARAPVVWNFVSKPDMTYAITSGGIYTTSDQGNSWDTYLSAPENTAILSFMTSEDSKTVAIGMSNGMIFSQDGGQNWIQLNEFMPGAVFDIQQGGETIWVLTTVSLFYSNDHGLTWDETALPLDEGEVIVSVVPGNHNNVLVLTNLSLYYSNDSMNWVEVPCAPFAEETIRQILAVDDSLSSFTVRTDSHIFQLTQNGWVSQNNLLFANDLGNMTTFNDSYSLAAATTPSGLWLAQNSPQIKLSPEYQRLFTQWSSEPDDYEVIQRALEAHFLGDMVDKKWGMRSRLSWLLPTLTFDYYFRQRNSDKSNLVLGFTNGYADGTANLTQKETYTLLREKTTYWQVMARWNIEIGKGLKDEINGTRLEANLRAKRGTVIKSVKGLLNKRHASQTTLYLQLPKLPETRKSTVKKALKTTLALEESEASLHYLTGGYYLPAIRNSETQN